MQVNKISAVGQTDLMKDIDNVQQRIREIQAQFDIKNFEPTNLSFEQALNKEMKAAKPAAQNKLQTNTVSAAAQKSNTGKAVSGNITPSDPSSTLDAPGQISDMIQKAAAKYGIDPKLLSAVAETESNYRPDAVSSAGAVGVMQLMPDTAASLGVSDPYDAQQNIDGGAKYLKELLGDFGGDVREAVAAYNAGPQAVKDYQGVPPYAETQNYVSHVLDLYQ